MSYSYTVAKDALSDNDKNRLLALFFSCNYSAISSVIDWEKATNEFGAASVDSMRVMVRGVLKKVEKAGGKDGVEASPAKATPAKAGGRKRKSAVVAEVDDDAEADNNGGVSKPKAKRGPKSAKEKFDDTLKDAMAEYGHVKEEAAAENEV